MSIKAPSKDETFWLVTSRKVANTIAEKFSPTDTVLAKVPATVLMIRASGMAPATLVLTIDAAVAESILHDLEPVQGSYEIAAEKAARTYVHRFEGYDLRVADLTSHHLNVLGGHAELSGTSSYVLPMPCSGAVFNHHENVDGFVYMTGLLTTQRSVVRFERGTSLGIQKDSSIALTKKPFARVRRDLNIRYG